MILCKKYIDIIFIIIYQYIIIHLIKTIKETCTLSEYFFLHPTDPMQRRYEALRASFVDGLSAQEVAQRFNYSTHTVNALRRDFKAGALPSFFNPLVRGPKQPRPSTLHSKDRIIELRKQNYSIDEIEEALLREGATITSKTIHQVLKAEGFTKLFRRTHAERRAALQKGKEQAEIATIKDFGAHRFVRTTYGGVFLFIPLILDLKLDSIFKQNSRCIPQVFAGQRNIARE